MNAARPRVRRLACYGWVTEQAGSVASAGYLVVADLVRRGVHIDLFAHRDHVPPPERLRGERFRYFGFEQPRWLDWVDKMPRGAPGAIRRLLLPVVAGSWRRVYQPVVEAEHGRDRYDAVLTLGTTPAFAIHAVPSITWLQSPLHTELEAIRRLRPQIEAVSGRLFYATLVAYYNYSQFVLRHGMIPSDRLILPSRWATQAMIARESPPAQVHAVPYPIDLEAFRPEPQASIDWDRPILLSVGRLDPRKRLDLLLSAFERVRQAVPGARLQVVGRPGYAPHQLSVLERHPLRAAVEYRAHVPRSQVPSLLREAAVLVQASENENFGSAVAESLACGTPVVVGPANGTAEYVDATSGIFESYTPESVARSILGTLERRRARPAEVRRSARRSAERWFSPTEVGAQVLAIVEAATSQQGAATLSER
jgi:glycosyltransferase involved in cell wall biosynthesis